MPPTPCPFCARLTSDQLVAENALAVAFRDAYPVSEGHTLIVPRVCEANYFALDEATQQAMWQLVQQVQARLVQELAQDRAPAGFNVGINVETAAGQTVMHCHIHLIPRYAGDMDDPRGGVRGVIPEKRIYG